MNRLKLTHNIHDILEPLITTANVRIEEDVNTRDLPVVVVTVSGEEDEEGMHGHSQCVLDLIIIDNTGQIETIRNEVDSVMCDPATLNGINKPQGVDERPRTDFHAYDIRHEDEDFEVLDNKGQQVTLSYRVWCCGRD